MKAYFLKSHDGIVKVGKLQASSCMKGKIISHNNLQKDYPSLSFQRLTGLPAFLTALFLISSFSFARVGDSWIDEQGNTHTVIEEWKSTPVIQETIIKKIENPFVKEIKKLSLKKNLLF